MYFWAEGGKSLLRRESYAPCFHFLKEKQDDIFWVLWKVLYRKDCQSLTSLSQDSCAHVKLQNLLPPHLRVAAYSPTCPICRDALMRRGYIWCICEPGHEKRWEEGRRTQQLNFRQEGAMEEGSLSRGNLWEVRSKIRPDSAGKAAGAVSWRRKRWWMGSWFKREGWEPNGKLFKRK